MNDLSYRDALALAAANAARRDFDEALATVGRAFLLPTEALAHELHVWWFESLPWWGRWWHIVTGHRGGRR